jgi:hypothetical protein
VLKIKNCLCGCGNIPKACCYVVEAPINLHIPKIIRESSLVYQLPFGMNITYSIGKGPGILSEDQLNPRITDALLFDMTQLHLFSPSERNELVLPLHTIFYHLRQCLYRLNKLRESVHSEVILAKYMTNNTMYQFEDVPLRCELESFILRLDSYFDLLSKYAGIQMGAKSNNGMTHGKLLKKFFSNKKNEDIEMVTTLEEKYWPIRSIYQVYYDWTGEIGYYRNQIMHQGLGLDITFPRSFHELSKYCPTINEKPIDKLLLESWENVIQFTRELVEKTTNDKIQSK